MHALFEVVLVLFVGWFSYVTRVLNKPCVAKETACATRRRDAGCFPFGWHEPPRSSHVLTCMHACMRKNICMQDRMMMLRVPLVTNLVELTALQVLRKLLGPYRIELLQLHACHAL